MLAVGCSNAPPADSETGAEPERECFACEAQRACMQSNCADQVESCWGASYFDGQNGGDCASVLDCLDTCACSDDACEMSCFADAEPACLSCTTQVRQCEQAMCEATSQCG